ncbi:MAG: hypothetical protein JOZ25_05915 [Actinobacteria bacterium]|nr:hypothetical protein [Actinomycetota bacterium]
MRGLAVNEIAPGIHHWTGIHPKIKVEVSSYHLADSGTLLDPLLPEGDLETIRGLDVQRIVLTNRHHLRSSEPIAAETGCPILCHEAGLHEFSESGLDVQGFSWGDELAPGVRALEVDAICDEETAILIDAGGGFLAVADGVIRYGGRLGFVPDQYIGEDPPAIHSAIREAYGRLLDLPFDSLLPAHGDPMIGGAREALGRFVEHGPE